MDITSRHTATRTIALGLLAITVCAALWLSFFRANDHRRTVVRLTRAVATGEYITGADIEAVQISIEANDGSDYVTTGQAGSGLIAAHDLAAGEVLLVPSVYAAGQQPPAQTTTAAPSSGWSTPGLLAIAGGGIGLLGVAVGMGRRRHGARPARPTPAPVLTDVPPGWLHVEVNTWIAEDGNWSRRPTVSSRAATSPPSDVEHDPAGSGSVEDVAELNLSTSKVEAVRLGWHSPDSPDADSDVDRDPVADVEEGPAAEEGVSVQPAKPVEPHRQFMPTAAEVDRATSEARTETREASQPVAVLQVFGEVKVVGVAVSQAAAAPFILAAAGRPMNTEELVELTGYAAKTFSSVYPASHPIVTRANGMLTLAPGVWTDHAWLAETVRRAADAVRNEHDQEAAEWLRQAFDLANRIDGAPYERVPRTRREALQGRRRDPWAWVDEFPYTMDARTHAGQEAVEAALAAAALWQAARPNDLLPATGVVEVLCRLARVLPDVPVTRTVRPSRWQTGAPCLLLAALEVADTKDLTSLVHATARRLVADQIIEADSDLADDLGM